VRTDRQALPRHVFQNASALLHIENIRTLSSKRHVARRIRARMSITMMFMHQNGAFICGNRPLTRSEAVDEKAVIARNRPAARGPLR
jgi:hypothetical protein